MAVQTDAHTGAVTVLLANDDLQLHALPYPAFQPVDALCTFRTRRQLGHVAVHPLRQQLYFAGYDADLQSGFVGHVSPDGSVSKYTPPQDSTGGPLLQDCFGLTFPADGAFLFFGNRVGNGSGA